MKTHPALWLAAVALAAGITAPAQTNQFGAKTVISPAPVARGTNAPAPVLPQTAYARQQLARLDTQSAALKQKISTLESAQAERTKRQSLVETSGQGTSANRAAWQRENEANNRTIADYRRQIAALELQKLDVRKRYRLPEVNERRQ